MLETIKLETNYVMNHASLVSIDQTKLEAFAITLKNQKSVHWLSNNPFGLLNLSKEALCLFLLIYDSIDFCFWGNPKWTIQTEDGPLDGAYALLYALLKEAKNNKDFLTPSYLKNLSKEELERILKGNIQIPFLEERFQRMTMIGTILSEKNGSSFYDMIKEFTLDTDLFSFLIQTFPFLNDSRCYKNKTIHFYKLAQLMTNDILQLRKIKEKIEIDVSHLVGCADYKIPQVIHQLGITNYMDKLEDTIKNKIELPENSSEEIEIRASTIVVIQTLATLTGISAIEINDLIWLQGQNKTITWLPYHLTRTTSY